MASTPALAGRPNPFVQGCQAMLKGQYEEAIVFLSVAAKAQPKNPKPVERLLKCYGALGRYADATKLLRAAAAKGLLSQSLVESDLKSTTALLRARSLHRSGKSDDAIRLLKPFAGKKCYYVAVELDIAKLLGELHYQKGELKEAADQFETVVNGSGRRGPALGVVERYLSSLLGSKQHARALDESERLDKWLKGRDAFLGNLRGACYLGLARSVVGPRKPEAAATARLKHASELLDKATASGPVDDDLVREIRFFKFDVHVPLGARLLKEAKAARAVGDTATENTRLWEIERYARRCVPKVRREARERLYEIRKEARKVHVEASKKHKVQRQDHGAEEAFKAILAKYPKTESAARCLWDLGTVYDRLGKRDLAQQARLRLIKQYPDSGLVPITCSVIADYCQYMKGDLAETEKYLRLAVERMPDATNADLCQYSIGTMYYQTGNFKRCYEEQKKFLKMYPKSDLRRRALLQIQVIERNGWKEVTKGEPRLPGKARNVKKSKSTGAKK